jgi:5-methylcytosine-specific restriction endonuclease McrA
MSSSHRWLKFWPQDWQRDPALRSCGVAARGLWIDMICLMVEGEPYGHLTIAGKPPTMRQIAMLTGSSEKEVTKLIGEMEDYGVFSRTEGGTIYSRRMVRDWEYEMKHKTWGKSGGNPDLILASGGSVPKEARTKRVTAQKNPRLYRSVFEEAGGKCELCGVEMTRDTPYAPNSFQLDHIIEIKNGGTNARDNLRAVCRKCNLARNFVARDNPRDDVRVNPRTGGTVNTSPGGRDKFLESESESESESEKKEPPKPPASGGLACDDGFEAFWQRYPRRDSKGHARKAWASAVRKAPADEILAGLERYQFSETTKYQPLPATWLNGERWLSDDGGGDGGGFDPVLRAVGLRPEDFEQPEFAMGRLLQ